VRHFTNYPYLAVNLDKIYIDHDKVSDTAKRKFNLMQDDGFDAATDYVRVGVKSGGCSGLSYDLKFDKNKEMMIKYSLTMI
jgi:Fe-S cluster assembly iron-binding protein IscA